MKKGFKYISLFFICLIIILYILFYNNIGTYKSNIENHTRISQNIPDNWEVSKDITEKISAMLFYDNSYNNHIYSIYVTRGGINFGYFFRGGGELGTIIQDGISEVHIDGYNESVYMSINKQEVCRAEIKGSGNIETIYIDNTKPFTLILPASGENVIMYDIDGNIIERTLTVL